MTQGLAEETESRYSLPENPSGTIRVVATPEALKFILRSNWGTFAAGSFTLLSQIGEFFTLAWIEDHQAGAVQKLVRIPDVFFHTVTLEFDRVRGLLVIAAQYQGRGSIQVDDLNALPGGVTLPATPAKPEFSKMRVRSATWTRDPAGADVDLRFKTLSIELSQGLISEWTMTDDWEVHKKGKTKARVTWTGNYSDETWDVLENARAGTKQQFRFVSASDAPASETLTMNFFEMDFEIEPTGKDGLIYSDFIGTGQAHIPVGGDVATIAIA